MRSLLVIVLPAISVAGFADEAQIQIDQVPSPAAPAGHDGVVYMTITGKGASDTPIGVTTPIAANATRHRSINDQGVMTMRPVGPLQIEPGKPVRIAPGGNHIMLSGLTQSLNRGDRFPVTLSFVEAGHVTTTASVIKAGATMPSADGAMPTTGGTPL